MPFSNNWDRVYGWWGEERFANVLSSQHLYLELYPSSSVLEDTSKRTTPSEDADTKGLTGPVIATCCKRGSSHCVFLLSEEREKKRGSLFSCKKFDITKDNVMGKKNHTVHTVIYVKDSSISVSSFFPSWL